MAMCLQRALDNSALAPTEVQVQRQRGLRFLLEAARDTRPEQLAEQLRRETSLPFRVQRLFGKVDRKADANNMQNMFLAVLPGISERDLEISAFDVAYSLTDALPGTIARAEPDLPQNVYEPHHDPANPLRLRSSGAGGRPPPLDRYWHLESIRVYDAWQLQPPQGGSRYGEGIIVGHPDTGWTDHLELGTKALDLQRQYDFVQGDRDARDPLDYRGNRGHGTKTASVIVSRGTVQPPSDQMVGVAPAAMLVPIRAIKSVVVFLGGDVAKAIHHAVENGCHVISMSLGGLGSWALEASVNYAVAKNVIVLAAAGNEVGFVVAPAKYDQCIAIAACNNAREPWEGSSRGKAVAVTAPGENVWVAQPGDAGGLGTDVGPGSGTSFAVATVAGMAALWLAYHGRDNLLSRYRDRATLQEVFRQVVRETAVPPVNWKLDRYGAGIVDAKALLSARLPIISLAPRLALEAGGIVAELRVQANTEHLARLFEDLPRKLVVRQLTTMMRGARAPVKKVRASEQPLERYATELMHIFGQNPVANRSFRRSIEAMAGARSRTAARGAAAESRAVARDVADFASTTLARVLVS